MPTAGLGRLPSFARFLLPEDAEWILTERWDLGELPAEGAALWGDQGDADGPRHALVRRAVAREVAVTRLRLQGRPVAIHRPAATTAARGVVRSTLRRSLVAGTLLEVGRVGRGALLDAVLEDAGLEPVGSPRAAADGGLLQFARTHEGDEVVLRAGFAGERGDPHRAAEGLVRVGGMSAVPSPRLLATGSIRSASWSVETRILGRPPRRTSRAVITDVLGALETLPRTERPVSSVGADLAVIAEVFPDHRDRIGQLDAVVHDAVNQERSVFAHGDLWPGNLIVRRGRLAGIIDWGAWRAAAPPGVDLLQLCAAVEHPRAPLGIVWLRRPWRTGEAATVLRDHLQRIGARRDTVYLDALGIAWWAAKVAGTLERSPERSDDGRWTATNVDPVIEAATAAP